MRLIDEQDSSLQQLSELQRLSDAILLRQCLLDMSSTASLAPFRAWRERCGTDYSYVRIKGTSVASMHCKLWRRYYQLLSLSLQQGDHAVLVELNAVQAIVEEIMLNENTFPYAEDATPEVDQWVDQVMANWRSSPHRTQSRLVLEVGFSFRLYLACAYPYFGQLACCGQAQSYLITFFAGLRLDTLPSGHPIISLLTYTPTFMSGPSQSCRI